MRGGRNIYQRANTHTYLYPHTHTHTQAAKPSGKSTGGGGAGSSSSKVLSPLIETGGLGDDVLGILKGYSNRLVLDIEVCVCVCFFFLTVDDEGIH